MGQFVMMWDVVGCCGPESPEPLFGPSLPLVYLMILRHWEMLGLDSFISYHASNALSF